MGMKAKKIEEYEEIEVGDENKAMHLALLDFLEAVDTVLEVEEINGYYEEDSCIWQDIESDKGFTVRVLPTDIGSVCHWNDDYLDPLWNVELIGEYPNIPVSARSFWIHSPKSYYLKKAK